MKTRLQQAISLTQDEIDDLLRGDDDDPVNSPQHYHLTLPDGYEIEAIDYIQAVLGDDGMVAYCRGSALKYLSRAGRKDDYAQDLRKAAWFCTKAAHVVEDNNRDVEF